VPDISNGKSRNFFIEYKNTTKIVKLKKPERD